MSGGIASIRLSDLIPLAWSALRRNKLRSGLTVGAIAFGVAVMVYLVSLGLGLQNLTIGNVLRSSTLLSFTVTSFNKDIKPLNDEAVAKVATIPQVTEVLPRLSIKGEISLVDKRYQATVIGVDPDFFAANQANPVKIGRPFGDGETTSMLVSTSFLKLFGLDQDKTPLVSFGMKLDSEYGDIPAVENMVVRGVISDDVAIAVYVPRAYLESLILKNKPDYQDARVLVKQLSDVEAASGAVIAQGYKVTTVVDTVDQINKVFSYIQITMGVLGAIAIIVASIGMFNTLTVSLLERTREIGIMKALGIRRRDVRRLFLAEAILIGILGGATGLGLALLFQQLTLFTFQVLALIAQGSVPDIFQNSWYLSVGALAFSLLIAATTGVYPANRAAKLNPIDAIRHE